MTLIRWDPFAEVLGLRRTVDRVSNGFPTPRLWQGGIEVVFPIDLSETDEAVVVRAVLPGIRPDDVDISISGRVLTVKGEAKFDEKTEQESYYRHEIRYGNFYRTIPLPTKVDPEHADAEFENGVLTVTLPKAADVRPKTIKVKSKELESAK